MSLNVETVIECDQSLCIEATAGSGKTTLMIERICHLLINQNVLPEKILAVTFTEKAAKEMKERLISALQDKNISKDAYKVVEQMMISTIHSVCHQWFSQYGILINYSPHYSVKDTIATDLKCKQVFESLIKQYQNDPPNWLTELLGAWSFQQLETMIKQAYYKRDRIEYWLENGNFDVEDESNEGFQQLLAQYLSHFKTCFDVFMNKMTEDKKANQWMDHDDILSATYQLLSNVDDVRYMIQSQLTHIFVDEFQDTSPIQWAIIKAICSDTDPYESKQLWMVGDRCQAIYGFRGADDQLMQMVIDTEHPKLVQVKNNRNFRSSSIIVRWVNELFHRLFGDVTQPFLAMDPLKVDDRGASVRCYIVDHERQGDEYRHIKASIQSHLGEYKYNDMAILVRKRSDIQRIEKMLPDIPLFVYKGGGLCELDSVQVVICFLKGILNPDDDIAWYGIARDIMGVSDDQLSQCSGAILSSIMNEPTMSKYNVILKKWFDQLNKGAYLDELQALIWGLDVVSSMSQSDRAAIARFLAAFVAQWKQSKVEEMRSWLDYCIEHPKALGADAEPERDAVQIMTLHAAKGLEFPVVIVPFIDAPFNFGATDPILVSRDKGLGVSVPGYSAENKVRKVIFESEKQRSILEELRLFYVTLTRAKQHVVLTGKTLKRKNQSRLSAMSEYLIPYAGDEYRFDFEYEADQIFTKHIEPMHEKESNIVNTKIDISYQQKVALNSISVSDILDMKDGKVRCNESHNRPSELFQTASQKKGDHLHMVMAHLLMHGNGDKCWELLGDPNKMNKHEMDEFIDRMVHAQWFKDVNASGKVYVEVPFEWNENNQQVKGRYDALWVSDDCKRVDVLEFKSSVSSNISRYKEQVLIYMDIVSKTTHVGANISGWLIDFKTGERMVIGCKSEEIKLV